MFRRSRPPASTSIICGLVKTGFVRLTKNARTHAFKTLLFLGDYDLSTLVRTLNMVFEKRNVIQCKSTTIGVKKTT